MWVFALSRRPGFDGAVVGGAAQGEARQQTLTARPAAYTMCSRGLFSVCCTRCEWDRCGINTLSVLL
jgi:hypothetical protein